jgi:hypothetical protein
MKKRILLVIVGSLAVIAGIGWLVNREFPVVAPVDPGETAEVSGKPHKEAHEAPSGGMAVQPVESNAPVVPPVLPSPDPAAMTAKIKEDTIERLMDLSANEDSGSLSTILSELENPDKEIRAAALEAAIQFGERTNTIARLTDLLQRIGDDDERAALREAIEFIKLPSLTEVAAARKAAGGSSSVVKLQQPPLASASRMPRASLRPPSSPAVHAGPK